MEDAFSAILNLLRLDTSQHAIKTFMIGTVLAVQPLSVDVGGLTQTAESLLINSALRNSSPLEAQTNVLAIGDRVLVLPYDDNQRFIVICKVVSA